MRVSITLIIFLTVVCITSAYADDGQENVKKMPRFKEPGASYPVGTTHFLPEKDKRKTLCLQEEEIYFSCIFKNKKTVSVCGTKDLTSKSGFIKYRFGKSKEAPELEYPKNDLNPQKSFKYFYEGYTKGSSIQLDFIIGDYNYILYNERHAFDVSGSGVVVQKKGKIVSHMKCIDNSIVSELEYFNELELPVLQRHEINIE